MIFGTFNPRFRPGFIKRVKAEKERQAAAPAKVAPPPAWMMKPEKPPAPRRR